MLTIQPLTVAMPVPVNIVPLQQNRYSPERLNNTTLVGTLSSCRQALKTLTVKVQLAVLPEVSVAVHVTVVVPAGNVEPDGGLQTVVTPGQLSEAVGAGKLTAVLVESGQVCAATAVTLAGQVMVGACVSLTVTVKEHITLSCRVVSSSQQKIVPVSPVALSTTTRVQVPSFGLPLKNVNGDCG
jgi:hypothetical protein